MRIVGGKYAGRNLTSPNDFRVRSYDTGLYYPPQHPAPPAGFEPAPGLPGVTVSLSSQVSPQMREYERFNTAVLNAYIGPVTKAYLDSLAGALRDRPDLPRRDVPRGPVLVDVRSGEQARVPPHGGGPGRPALGERLGRRLRQGPDPGPAQHGVDGRRHGARRGQRVVPADQLDQRPVEAPPPSFVVFCDKPVGEEVQAVKGFTVIATANNRDRGVNELSSAPRPSMLAIAQSPARPNAPAAEHEATWRDMVFQVVRRAPNVHAWELGNEPDHQGTFLGGPLAYARWASLASDGIRAANPRARIAVGAV